MGVNTRQGAAGGRTHGTRTSPPRDGRIAARGSVTCVLTVSPMDGTPGRPYLWRTSVTIVSVLGVAAVGAAVWAFAIIARAFGIGESRHADFDRDREDLDAVVAWVNGTKHESEYYTELPQDLAHLSGTEDGLISIGPDGRVFVPQWAGIPDDAGGYIYSPDDTSPEGWDMWGMDCENQTRLDGGWWACGLRYTP